MLSDLARSSTASLDTAQSLAKFLNISTAYVRKLTRTTNIPVTRIGHAVRYDRAAVLAWLAAGGPQKNSNGHAAAAGVGDVHNK